MVNSPCTHTHTNTHTHKHTHTHTHTQTHTHTWECTFNGNSDILHSLTDTVIEYRTIVSCNDKTEIDKDNFANLSKISVKLSNALILPVRLTITRPSMRSLLDPRHSLSVGSTLSTTYTLLPTRGR